jgi:small basic protein
MNRICFIKRIFVSTFVFIIIMYILLWEHCTTNGVSLAIISVTAVGGPIEKKVPEDLFKWISDPVRNFK